MKTRKLALGRVILSFTLAIVVAWSVLVGNSVFVIFAILAGFVVTVFLRRKDERLRVDERNQLINEKASMQTVRTFMLGTTLVGAVVVALGNGGYPDFSPMGFTLLYSVCALMIINMVFGAYYLRKYGG